MNSPSPAPNEKPNESRPNLDVHGLLRAALQPDTHPGDLPPEENASGKNAPGLGENAQGPGENAHDPGEFGPGMDKTQPMAADEALSIASIQKDFPSLEILEPLGGGGMGVVYKARQKSLDRMVALKILKSRLSKDARFADRFTREARALARLNHPNIVAIHDFGQANGRFFFLMEYVDGANLRQILRRGPMKSAEALAIVPKVCEALQYAHEESVVHRDIKPENILLDSRGRVKVADFGLAKLLGVAPSEPLLTESTAVIGTPYYMAPEQIEHPLEVDQRADVYSVGVLLYEMLTGELPLGHFLAPSKRVQIDVRLDEVVLRALEKDPQQRYQRVSEIKSGIDGIMGVAPQTGEAASGGNAAGAACATGASSDGGAPGGSSVSMISIPASVFAGASASTPAQTSPRASSAPPQSAGRSATGGAHSAEGAQSAPHASASQSGRSAQSAASSGAAPSSSGLAFLALIFGILSLALGIFGVGILLAPLAIILGIIAGFRNRQRPEVHGGFRMALAAIITGAFGLLLSIIALPMILAIALPNILEARNRSKISQAYMGMNETFQGLKAYEVDNGHLPPSRVFMDRSGRTLVPPEKLDPWMRKELQKSAGPLLTTPIAYLTRIPIDPFTNQPFMVAVRDDVWLVCSPGPDGVFNLDWKMLFDPDSLMRQSYDPTNGVVSAGDLWRRYDGIHSDMYDPWEEQKARFAPSATLKVKRSKAPAPIEKSNAPSTNSQPANSPSTNSLSSHSPYDNPTSAGRLRFERVNIETATLDDVVRAYGEPNQYMWNNNPLKKSDLPAEYLMNYGGQFQVYMKKGAIQELRHSEPDYSYEGKLPIGAPLEKAVEFLGPPALMLTGQPNEFKDSVLYRDIAGAKGNGYYSRPDLGVRVWFRNDKVSFIYVVRQTPLARSTPELRHAPAPRALPKAEAEESK